MPNPAYPLLALALVAGARWDRNARLEPVSRIENRTPAEWRLAMGRWVAGEISIREPDGAELARLKREGQGFVLASGQAVDMALLPAADSLALQLTLSRAATAGPRSSVYLSAGEAHAAPTVIVSAEPAVRVNKACYGSPKAGPFILLRESGDVAGNASGDAGAGAF